MEAIMGGSGSGRRWFFNSKETTSDHRTLDVRRWKKDGLLFNGSAFSWQWLRRKKVIASIRIRVEEDKVNLIYRHQNRGETEWKDENYPVSLDWTPCHIGGERPWFLCPAKGCNRRIAILYDGGIFACRHCYNLAYESQRETPDNRATRKADKIREKLDWEPGILNPNGWKPKGMHWKTYERLTAKHDTFVNSSIAGIVKRFNLTL